MINPASGMTGMMPGFDFLNTLAQGASAAMPGMGQWITPTLDPAELDKRIKELRTVLFWLEQNAKLLGSTIQALEVQRMTLTTLKSMNVSLGELADSLKVKVPPASATAAAEAPPAAASPAADPAGPAPAAADPMQWWGALTQQFTALASKAVEESAAVASRVAAGQPQAELGAGTADAVAAGKASAGTAKVRTTEGRTTEGRTTKARTRAPGRRPD